MVDLQASPPQARVREGDRVSLNVREVGCAFTPAYQVRGWTVTDPTVAAVDSDAYPGPEFLRAMRPGQTRILADVVHVDGSPVQAELGYCPGALSSCTPTKLVLNVVR